ncbi:hypothetical protein [Enterococcus sp. AZ103]
MEINAEQLIEELIKKISMLELENAKLTVALNSQSKPIKDDKVGED